jgi:hypothetical protein
MRREEVAVVDVVVVGVSFENIRASSQAYNCYVDK